MPRLPDWPERLAATLALWRTQPFVWGQRDCGQFALACIEAQIGVRLIALPPYTSARAAKRMLRSFGVADGPALTDKLLGARSSAAQLGRGDIVLLEQSALGVCFGEKIWAMAASGLTALPRAAAQAGWRVSCQQF
jgi:hypothetical protein